MQTLDIHDTRIGDDGLKYLAGANKLRVLNLPARVTDEGLKHLRNCTELRSLSVVEPSITARGLAYLEKSQLHSVAGPHSYDADDLLYISKLRRLESANLSHLQMNPAHFSELSKLQATSLTLASTAVDDSIMPHLKKMPNLENLSILRSRITDEGCKEFVEFPTLKYLTLHSSLLTPGCIEPLSALKTRVFFDNVQSPWLDVRGDERIGSLTGAIKALRSQSRLFLTADVALFNEPPWLQGRELENLRHLPRVADLSLDGNVTRHCDLSVLRQYENIKKLRVSFKDNFDRKSQDSVLAAIASLEQLEEVTVAGQFLSAEQLLVLKRLPNLKRLNCEIAPFSEKDWMLLYNQLDRKVVAYVNYGDVKDRTLRLKRLHRNSVDLVLASPHVTDTLLTRMSDYPALRSVEIHSLSVDGSGLKTITHHVDMRHLELDDCSIRDDSIALLPRTLSTLSLKASGRKEFTMM